VNGPIVFLVLVGAAALFFFLSRQSSSPSSDGPMHDPDWRPEELLPQDEEDNEPPAVPSVVGSEIPLPQEIQQLEAEFSNLLSAPALVNYYFKTIDLVEGPKDPANFSDEFSAVMRNADTNYQWTVTYTVTTTKALEEMIAQEKYRYVFGDGMIIFPKYDLAAILRAIFERHMDTEPNYDSEAQKEPTDLR
jgi:hypothetical protein